MDEKLVRKALGALEGQQRQRSEAIEVLVRHLTNDTPDCQETINRLFDVLDVPQAVAENEQAEEVREELEAELDESPSKRSRRELHLASFH